MFNRTAPLFVMLIIWGGSLGFSYTVLAAKCPTDQVCLESPLEQIDPKTGKSSDVTDFPTVLGTVIKAALGIIGSITLLMLIWGGFQWLTSAGNPEKVKKGTQTMIWAAVGAFLVLSSYLIMSTFTDYLVSGGSQATPSAATSCKQDADCKNSDAVCLSGQCVPKLQSL